MKEPARRSESYTPRNRGRMRWRVQLKEQLQKFPLLEGLLRKLRRIYLQARSSFLNRFAAFRIKDLEVNKTLWISPDQIKYCSLKEFNPHEFRGSVISGDWDKLEKEFTDLDVYVAFEQVFFQGLRWEQTVFYQRILEKIKAGQVMWGCSTKGEFDQRCAGLEDLFERIQREGYKSQGELLQERSSLGRGDPEVTISIGRDGDLMFSASAHRLSIAKLLGVEQIPVQVAVRHPEWINFRKSLSLYAEERGGKIYQSIMHPDLEDITASHICEDRFDLIVNNMTATSGTLLDLGANLGYFSHKFEELGFECIAVEDSVRTLHFLKELKRVGNRHFRVIGKSLFESPELFETRYEVVLALNIFHHFLGTKEAYEKLVEFLGKLQVDELFLEPHLPEESHHFGIYKSYSPEEFVEFVLDSSNLSKAEFTGEATDRRKIFRLHM